MKQEILQLTLDLCHIPSISGDEIDCALFLCEKLEALGFVVEKIPVDEKRFNILAYFSKKPKFSAIFCSHIDTVAPFIAPQFNGGMLWGRGVLDAKGIIAAMVFSVVNQRKAGFDDLALLFTVGEEESSDGAKACLLKDRAKLLVVGEPTDLKAASHQKGSLVFDLKAQGIEAHSSMPHLGDSAVHKLITAMHDLLLNPWPKDKDFGETFINFGKISGGDMRNMLANHAFAQGIMRISRPAKEIELVLKQLTSGLDLQILSSSDPFNYFVIPGFETFIAGFGSDAPYLKNVGPSMLLGPGSIEFAHKENENVALEELYLGALAYEKIALNIR